jgi:hypothetical protein
MNRLLFLGALCGILCSAGATHARPLPAPPASLPPATPEKNVVRWEYKVTIYNRVAVFGDSDHEMRLLGLMGWELVSTTYDPHARTIVCFYKRPVGSAAAEATSPRP